MTELFVSRGGEGGPQLVLLHGMGSNGAVWEPLLPLVRARWAGRWLAPDLRGHGRSRRAAADGRYSFAGHALDVAGLIDANDPLFVLGHSMGGAVGLLLATGWFGVHPALVVGFGVKAAAWTASQKEAFTRLAGSPPRWFDDRADAEAAYVRFNGLGGLPGVGATVEAGIAEDSGRWRLRFDNRAMLGDDPPTGAAFRSAAGAARLLIGDADTLVSVEETLAADPAAVVLPGAMHNVHIADPAALWEAFERLAGALGGG